MECHLLALFLIEYNEIAQMLIRSEADVNAVGNGGKYQNPVKVNEMSQNSRSLQDSHRCSRQQIHPKEMSKSSELSSKMEQT